MEEQRYLISDAAKMVAVEAHVLRYWEEELELAIGRTELGHRYYTRENIDTFRNIKELKEKGLQLKAIKVILKGLEQKKRETEGDKDKEPDEMMREGDRQEDEYESTSMMVIEDNTKKLQQFEELVAGIVDKVVKENNEKLQEEIESSFSREMDYFLHMQESREEERYRKLDEAIRAHQKNSRMVAATKEKSFLRRWLWK